MKPPAWGADIQGAERAQALIVLWTPEAETPPPLARPDRLTAVIGLGGIDALAAIGLAQVIAETAI